MLDVDHGTYPFRDLLEHPRRRGCPRLRHGSGCRSAMSSASPKPIRRGSAKAPSRPSLDDEIGRGLGERGHEFGTVTSRPRRCGWFDAVMVRQAIKIGGIHGMALTKLDVLDGMETAQDLHGLSPLRSDPSSPARAVSAPRRVSSRSMRSWRVGRTALAGARSFADLPAQAVKYIKRSGRAWLKRLSRSFRPAPIVKTPFSCATRFAD